MADTEFIKKTLHILHLEDNPLDAVMIHDKLEAEGVLCNIVHVDGREGFQAALNRQTFDLVLSDYNVPNWDGAAALKMAREKQPATPVIVISGSLEEEEAVQCLQMGATDYLIKHRLERLVPAVRRALAEAREHRKREEAAAALKESERRYRALVDNALVGVYRTTLQGAVLYANEALAVMLAFDSPQALMATSFKERYARPEQRETLLARLKEIGKVHNLELELLTRAGQVRNVLLSAIFSGDTLSGMVIDITGRKRAEADLRDSQMRFQSVWRHSPDGLRLTDGNGIIVEVNEAYCGLVGMKVEELERQPFTVTYTGDRDPAELLGKYRRRFAERKIANHLMRRVTYRSGRTLEVEVSTAFIESPDKRTLLLSIFHDITERRQAEEALRASEEQVRRLVDSSLDMIIAVDKDRRITQFNPAAESVFGYAKKEILGQPVDVLYANPEDGRRVHDTTVLNGRCVQEILNRRQNGEVFPSLLAASVLREANGQLAGVMGISRDITKQKQAEEQLRQQQQFQQSILDTLPVGVWFMDRRRSLQLVNPADHAIWAGGAGVPAERVQDFKLWQAGLMQRVLQEQWGIVRALTEGRATSQEAHEVVGFDGQRRFILHSAVPLLGAGAQALGALAINQDVTQSVLANERIREQADLLDKARDAILVCGMDQRIIYWNESAQRLYGWTAEEVKGREAAELLFAAAPENLAGAEQRLLETGEWAGEMTHQTKNGGLITVESHWTLVRDEAGQPKAKLVINTDITEKKQIESQFLRAQRMESIGMLAGGIAHDLNNVLAPILMAAQLLRDSLSDQRDARILDTLEASARRGTDLVQQVLSFARGKEGERKQLQLGHLISEMEKMARDTFPKSIHFQRKLPADGLWPVEANPTHIHQVLLNLCLNARDAMPQGGRLTVTADNVVLDELQTQRLTGLRPGNYVLLKVEDTGTGIPAAIRDKIFLPFFTTKAEGHGTGLGLATVMGIVKNHQGFLAVDSLPGKGTSFSVYLPAVTETATSADAEGIPPVLKGNGENILVAEDEAGVRELIFTILSRNGYRVGTANDGTEAIALFVQSQPPIDLVLTDVNMPHMDGAALIRSLRKLKPDLEIIVMTGMVDNFDSIQISSGQPIPVLHKPFNSKLLLQAIHDALHERAP